MKRTLLAAGLIALTMLAVGAIAAARAEPIVFPSPSEYFINNPHEPIPMLPPISRSHAEYVFGAWDAFLTICGYQGRVSGRMPNRVGNMLYMAGVWLDGDFGRTIKTAVIEEAKTWSKEKREQYCADTTRVFVKATCYGHPTEGGQCPTAAWKYSPAIKMCVETNCP
jgi:hypothetical protein